MSDKQEPKYINSSRRGFLQGAAVASGTIVAGAAISDGNLPAADDLLQQTEDQPGHKGYKLWRY